MSGLDALLTGMGPHATFHDAHLLGVHVEDAGKTVTARFALCVGDPDAASREQREARRAGVLKLAGPLFWVHDPPNDAGLNARAPHLLADDGPLQDAPTQTGPRLADVLPADAWSCYLYFSDTNSFIYCAARSASFRWLD